MGSVWLSTRSYMNEFAPYVMQAPPLRDALVKGLQELIIVKVYMFQNSAK